MKIYEQNKLYNQDEYHAAESLIQEYMYRNDPEAERVLDKLFQLVSAFEDKHQAVPELFESIDIDEDPFEDIRDWT